MYELGILAIWIFFFFFFFKKFSEAVLKSSIIMREYNVKRSNLALGPRICRPTPKNAKSRSKSNRSNLKHC